jgi:hypothetical protein
MLSITLGGIVVVGTWLFAVDSSPIRQYFYSHRLEIPAWFSFVQAPPLVFFPALFSMAFGGFENERAHILLPIGIVLQWTALGFAALTLACRRRAPE